MSETKLRVYSSLQQIERAFPNKRYFFLIRNAADLFIANKDDMKILVSRFVINDVSSDNSSRYPGAYADVPKLSVYDAKIGQRYITSANTVIELLLTEGYYAVYGHNRFCIGDNINDFYQPNAINAAILAHKNKLAQH